MKDVRSYEQLIESCLAGEMTAEDRRAFLDRLETDADLRGEFVRQSGTDRLLQEALRPERGQLDQFRRATLGLAQSLPDEQFRQEVWNKIAASTGATPEDTGVGEPRLRVLPAEPSRVWLRIAAGLVLAAGTAIVAMQIGIRKAGQPIASALSPEAVPVMIASVDSVFGSDVKVAPAKGVWQQVSAGQQLISGSQIQIGKDGRCCVRFLDDTKIDVAGDARVGVSVRDGQKVCQATGGDSRYVVSPQPVGRPLIIEGRDAVITVKGTVFTVMDKGQSTLIRVAEGEISVRDPTGSNAVPLRAGQMMEAVRGQPLVAGAGDINKAEALKNKGKGLRESGRLQEAEQELREAIVWYPEPANFRAFEQLLLSQYERGDLAGCVTAIEEVQRRYPKHWFRAYAEIMLYLCELQLGKPTNGLAKYREGYTGNDWPAPVMDMFLGTITPEALLAKAPGDGEKCSACYYAGEWYLYKGDKAQARRYFEESSRMTVNWSEPTTARRRLEQLDLRP